MCVLAALRKLSSQWYRIISIFLLQANTNWESNQVDLYGDTPHTLEAKKTTRSACHRFLLSHQNHWVKMDLLFFSLHAVTVPLCRKAQKSCSTLALDQFCSLVDSARLYGGGPQSWLETPAPPLAPPCCSLQTSLFSISLVFHIPVFAQLCCPLWNLVHCGLCVNVLQRTVLNSNYARVGLPHTLL